MLDVHYTLSPNSHYLLDVVRDDSERKIAPQMAACYSLQIIQLVEGPPPPPRVVDTDDSLSCSSSSWSSSEDDDDEEMAESYCSSEDDLPPAENDDGPCTPPDLEQRSSSDETYSLRMKRILAWREDFSSHLSATISDTSLSSSLKRKFQYDEEDEDAFSLSSKRSRSSSLGEHSCPACDASFDSPQSLRQHGKAGSSSEACSVAVEYAFES